MKYDPALADRENVEFYWDLLKIKDAETMPALLDRYTFYYKRDVRSPEVYRGSNVITYREIFEPLLTFADSRHADLIEKFIVENPQLAPLRDQVLEIRKRPAPPARVEPPFRLGQKLVEP